jgi:hypothetical protein
MRLQELKANQEHQLLQLQVACDGQEKRLTELKHATEQEVKDRQAAKKSCDDAIMETRDAQAALAIAKAKLDEEQHQHRTSQSHVPPSSIRHSNNGTLSQFGSPGSLLSPIATRTDISPSSQRDRRISVTNQTSSVASDDASDPSSGSSRVSGMSMLSASTGHGDANHRRIAMLEAQVDRLTALNNELRHEYDSVLQRRRDAGLTVPSPLPPPPHTQHDNDEPQHETPSSSASSGRITPSPSMSSTSDIDTHSRHQLQHQTPSNNNTTTTSRINDDDQDRSHSPPIHVPAASSSLASERALLQQLHDECNRARQELHDIRQRIRTANDELLRAQRAHTELTDAANEIMKPTKVVSTTSLPIPAVAGTLIPAVPSVAVTTVSTEEIALLEERRERVRREVTVEEREIERLRDRRAKLGVEFDSYEGICNERRKELKELIHKLEQRGASCATEIKQQIDHGQRRVTELKAMIAMLKVEREELRMSSTSSTSTPTTSLTASGKSTSNKGKISSKKGSNVAAAASVVAAKRASALSSSGSNKGVVALSRSGNIRSSMKKSSHKRSVSTDSSNTSVSGNEQIFDFEADLQVLRRSHSPPSSSLSPTNITTNGDQSTTGKATIVSMTPVNGQRSGSRTARIRVSVAAADSSASSVASMSPTPSPSTVPPSSLSQSIRHHSKEKKRAPESRSRSSSPSSSHGREANKSGSGSGSDSTQRPQRGSSMRRPPSSSNSVSTTALTIDSVDQERIVTERLKQRLRNLNLPAPPPSSSSTQPQPQPIPASASRPSTTSTPLEWKIPSSSSSSSNNGGSRNRSRVHDSQFERAEQLRLQVEDVVRRTQETLTTNAIAVATAPPSSTTTTRSSRSPPRGNAATKANVPPSTRRPSSTIRRGTSQQHRYDDSPSSSSIASSQPPSPLPSSIVHRSPAAARPPSSVAAVVTSSSSRQPTNAGVPSQPLPSSSTLTISASLPSQSLSSVDDAFDPSERSLQSSPIDGSSSIRRPTSITATAAASRLNRTATSLNVGDITGDDDDPLAIARGAVAPTTTATSARPLASNVRPRTVRISDEEDDERAERELAEALARPLF